MRLLRWKKVVIECRANIFNIPEVAYLEIETDVKKVK